MRGRPAMDRWTEVSGDPNSVEARAVRREQMKRAFRSSGPDRDMHILETCSGMHVLDVGCVDHDIENIGPEHPWLHARIVDSAATAVGIDVVQAGIDRMSVMGYDAHLCDVTQDISPIEDEGPFDVVIAADVIEHLGNPIGLLENAIRLLRPAGKLVLSSPNPHAVGRVRASQLNLTFENVDHTVFLFSSGIAEMASRTGMVLEQYWSADHVDPYILMRHTLGHGLKRLISGPTSLPSRYISILELLAYLTRRRWLMGETIIYELIKP